MKKYTLIYADPPWLYRDKAADGNRGAGFKYPVMNVLDICRLPVWELAAEIACWLCGGCRLSRQRRWRSSRHGGSG